MLSVTSCSYCATISAAELRLPAVQLAHVRARVRCLQPGHAVRAAQLDDDHIGALGLAAQRLEEVDPQRGHMVIAATAANLRAARRTEGIGNAATSHPTRRTHGRSGGMPLVQRRDELSAGPGGQVGAEVERARARLAPSRTGRRPRCTAADRAPPARGAPRRRRRGRPPSRWRARPRRAARTRRAARCRAPGAPAPSWSTSQPSASRKSATIRSAERVQLLGRPRDDREPPVLRRAAAAAATGRRGSTGRPRSRSAPRRR